MGGGGIPPPEEPLLGGVGIPPPGGGGMPLGGVGIPPPDEVDDSSLQAPVTAAANAMNKNGLTQLGIELNN